MMITINDDIIIYIHRRAFLEVKKESTRTVFHIWDLNSRVKHSDDNFLKFSNSRH
jgi:hypothetical protein